MEMVDTTPVLTTPAGAAMNQMFGGENQPPQIVVQPSAPVVPNGNATPPAPQQPQLDMGAYYQMVGQPQPGQPVAPQTPPAQADALPPATPAQPAPSKPNVEMIPTARFQQVLSQRNAESQRAAELEAKYNRLYGYVQAISQQTQAPQQQQPAPDLIADPNGWAAHVQQQAEARAVERTSEQTRQLQEQLAAMQEAQRFSVMKASEAAAMAKHGPNAMAIINAATVAAVQAGLKDQFMNTADPIGKAIEWYQANQVRSTFGNDPATVMQRAEQRLMQDPQFVARVAAQLRQGASKPAVIPPPPGMMPRAGTITPNGTMFPSGGSAVAAMLASR